MLRTIGTRHCPFLHTDSSLPVSSCPPGGLFFLSCNDVTSLNVHIFMQTQSSSRKRKNFNKEIQFCIE